METRLKRLEKVLPNIIHFDQNAYVKGRTIFDAVRTIDDVIKFTTRKGHKGILTAIDFEKRPSIRLTDVFFLER